MYLCHISCSLKYGTLVLLWAPNIYVLSNFDTFFKWKYKVLECPIKKFANFVELFCYLPKCFKTLLKWRNQSKYFTALLMSNLLPFSQKQQFALLTVFLVRGAFSQYLASASLEGFTETQEASFESSKFKQFFLLLGMLNGSKRNDFF